MIKVDYTDNHIDFSRPAIMTSATLTPDMPVDLQQAISQFAALSGQTAAAITEAALRDFLAWRTPQLLDLKEAIAASDRDEFASDEEANAFFARVGGASPLSIELSN